MKKILKYTASVAAVALLCLTSCKKETGTETTTETMETTTETDMSPMDTVVTDNDTVIETGTSKDVQAPAEDQVP